MLKGTVSMVYVNSEYRIPSVFQFKNGRMTKNGMWADYCLGNNVWRTDGFFPLNIGEQNWVISEIQFTLD